MGAEKDIRYSPELVDWRAVDCRRNGGSLNRRHRQIVLSATYRQSSRIRPEHLERDSENRWLSRGPSVRLEAEIIRDSALRASGLLSDTMGGPGVYPPQPSGVTEVAYGGAAWPTSQGQDRYRRSLYTFTKRTAPFAMFNTFDAPTGESCLARRDTSHTTLQALPPVPYTHPTPPTHLLVSTTFSTLSLSNKHRNQPHDQMLQETRNRHKD